MKIEISKAEEEEARLTGYALGELDAGESEAVEALLESSPEARALLEEIRATAALLSAEFSNEPSLSLHEEQVEAITGTGKGNVAVSSPGTGTSCRWERWQPVPACSPLSG